MKSYILVSLFFLIGNIILSQNYVDLLKISAGTTPYNQFDSSSAKTKIHDLSADLTIPLKINEKTSVITGIIYEAIQTKLFNDGDYVNFGSTTLKLGINKQFNDRWSVTAVALPKIASDYKSYSDKDFQLGGLAVFKFRKRENLNYKVGLYYNSELFGPLFVPMAGLYYLSPNKKFEANLMLPLQADINYQIIPLMNVGVNFVGQIRSYHLNHITDKHSNTYIARSSNDIYGYIKFNFTKNISLQTKLGQSIGRSYRVYDVKDNANFGLPATILGPKREQLNSDFSDGLLFQVALLYRLSLDKK
jgi:hypothetical protein